MKKHQHLKYSLYHLRVTALVYIRLDALHTDRPLFL
ncbi:unnamed protein product [Larinioides sclopetarius]|uniref:Uncharacterized protein n=1 Tax=Larinioides sclopetarius TaxID=280406 RepID=A0AAV2B4S6_9ARAC